MSNLNQTCAHPFTNEVDGFLTCVGCGLVLENSIFLDENSSKKKCLWNEIIEEKYSRFYEKNEDKKNENFKNIVRLKSKILLLREMYERDFFSLQILHEAENLLTLWKKNKVPFSNFHCAYSIYFASKKNNFPLIFNQITSFLNINEKDVLRLEKILPTHTIIPSSKFVNKFGAIMKVPYKDIVKISKISDILFEKINISSPVLAVSLIFYFFPSLNLLFLSRISNVSQPTIKKWVKILSQNQYLLSFEN